MDQQWTFYLDSAPLRPYIGAPAPYPTRHSGVWRWGEAPNDHIEDYHRLINEKLQKANAELRAEVDAYFQEIREALGMTVQEIRANYVIESFPVEVEKIDGEDGSMTFKLRETFRLVPKKRG